MTHEETPLALRLAAAPSPPDVRDWERRDGYYVATCRVSTADVPELIQLARRWSEDPDPDTGDLPGLDDELAPVTAWRALADLQATEAVGPLVELMVTMGQTNDDWILEELPHVFGKIGQAALEPLILAARTSEHPRRTRMVAASGLGCMARYHPETRERVVASLTELLANADESTITFNTVVMSELVDLQAVEAAEVIERAFSRDLVDCGWLGDWEDARELLGVEGLGLEMPTNSHNSVRELRQSFGYSVFSDRPIFSSDEDTEEVKEAYLERASRAFSQSSEGQRAIELYGQLTWHQTLIDFAATYYREVVDTMTVDTIEEFLFGFVPQRSTVGPEAAGEIVGELTLFWEYLERVYRLPPSAEMLEWLRSEGLEADLQEKLADDSRHGLFKAMITQGMAAGFDMTTDAGIAAFMASYYQFGNRPRPSPAPPKPDTARFVPLPEKTSQPKVGRNEPCPCGSGKKYKKCCGNRAAQAPGG